MSSPENCTPSICPRCSGVLPFGITDLADFRQTGVLLRKRNSDDQRGRLGQRLAAESLQPVGCGGATTLRLTVNSSVSQVGNVLVAGPMRRQVASELGERWAFPIAGKMIAKKMQWAIVDRHSESESPEELSADR